MSCGHMNGIGLFLKNLIFYAIIIYCRKLRRLQQFFFDVFKTLLVLMLEFSEDLDSPCVPMFCSGNKLLTINFMTCCF